MQNICNVMYPEVFNVYLIFFLNKVI